MADGETLIETVGAQVTEPFAIARTRAHDLWQYQHRLIRKILVHTVVVFSVSRWKVLHIGNSF